MLKRNLVVALLALVLTVGAVAPAAAATHLVFCFVMYGQEYCIKIPLAYKIEFKVPPDKQPLDALDISRVKHSLEEIYRSDPASQPWLRAIVENREQQPWILTSPNGDHVVLFDMVNGAAIQVEAEVGY